MADTPLIEMRNIYKSFGGIHAVEDVSVEVAPGEVLGIVGHNGAGKSTLVKMLSGAYQMDSGEIYVNGEPGGDQHAPRRPPLRDRNPLPAPGARRQPRFGRQPVPRREILTRYGTLDNEAMHARRARSSTASTPTSEPSKTRFSIFPAASASRSPSVARSTQRQVPDHGRADRGAWAPRKRDVQELVLRLKSEGIGMFMISHDIHDVFDISDRVSVMTNGRLVGTRKTSEVTKDQVLGMIILGKQPEEETAEDIAQLH